jgi:RNA polymerase sigma-70 factor (ECF subfamily)
LTNNIAYQNLDKQLFEQLFREYFSHLSNFALSYVNDLDTAKEIVQEVFINLWNNKDSITSDKSVKSYLYTSVRNRCLNYIRDHKKFRSYVLDVEIEDADQVFENNSISQTETQIKIQQALSKLPEKCKQVFELSRFEELKYKEIAEKLGISIKTVEGQVSKALKILREELKDLIISMLLIILMFL